MSSRLRTESCAHRDEWYDLPSAPQCSSLTAVQPDHMHHHLSLGFLAFFSYRMRTTSPVTVPTAFVPPNHFPNQSLTAPSRRKLWPVLLGHTAIHHDSSLETPSILNISIAHMTRASDCGQIRG